ncbi:unnamed protein product [Euphydryas editha]|uniref:Uncharacterized protein n=1 Tax=Euphydryas editha TaxID=104508 RepID=A0AAU9U4T1_EUPED|nr:unnamed protein product [Euphydryas editha]
MTCCMKREFKTTAYESLQGLYEIIRSLSDSRNRHKSNLEKERGRHAQELVRVERAHNKELQHLKQSLLSELQTVHKDIGATLKETQVVCTWLVYEIDEPFRPIKEIRESQAELDTKLRSLSKMVSSQGAETVTPEIEKKMEESLKSVGERIGSLSSQLEKLTG